jgi:cell division protein FtsB
VTRARAVGLGFFLLGAAFAAGGGEYSTWAWYKLRTQERVERTAVDSLIRAVDSLETLARALETDLATQERTARESFGMIRDGEYLLRLPAAPAGP